MQMYVFGSFENQFKQYRKLLVFRGLLAFAAVFQLLSLRRSKFEHICGNDKDLHPTQTPSKFAVYNYISLTFKFAHKFL